jgi:hypothetical protein
MTRTLIFLSDPAWWLSTVIVGIAINILSGYVKEFLDRRRHRLIAKWKDQAQARDQRLQKDARAITDSFEVRQEFMLHLVLQEITFFKLMLVTVLGFLMAVILEIRISSFPGDPTVTGWAIALRCSYFALVLTLVLAFTWDRYVATSRKMLSRVRPAIRK